MEFQKCLKQTLFNICNSLYFNIFGQKAIPGWYLLLTYSLQYFTPGLGPEVLNVGNHLKPIQFYILNNFCVNRCAQKSTPGGILALLLLLAVYGSRLGPDGPGVLEEP